MTHSNKYKVITLIAKYSFDHLGMTTWIWPQLKKLMQIFHQPMRSFKTLWKAAFNSLLLLQEQTCWYVLYWRQIASDIVELYIDQVPAVLLHRVYFDVHKIL